MSMSVCLSLSVYVCVCVFVCPRSYLRNYTSDLHQNFVHVTCDRGSILFWRRSDTLCISGFVDDVMFAYKLIACSTSPTGWGSEAHTYAALTFARMDARGYFLSCSQGLLGRNGRVQYLWHHACTQCPCIYSDKKMTCAYTTVAPRCNTGGGVCDLTSLFLVQLFLSKYAIESWFNFPPQLCNVRTLPC